MVVVRRLYWQLQMTSFGELSRSNREQRLVELAIAICGTHWFGRGDNCGGGVRWRSGWLRFLTCGFCYFMFFFCC